jgi:hypothetical protein
VARAVTLTNLRTWIRQLSDTENDDNVSDTELTALVNRHLAEVYDLLIDSGPPDYYASTTTVSVTSGTIAYALQSDFRALLGVYVHESSDERRPILPMPEGTRGKFKAPTATATITVEYIPAAPLLSSGSDTFDGVSGWEELIVTRAARDVMIKRESDPSAVMATASMLEQRIRVRAKNRDRSAPKRIVDLDEVGSTGWPWGWTGSSRVACYRLRAGNIEIYEPMWGAP